MVFLVFSSAYLDVAEAMTAAGSPDGKTRSADLPPEKQALIRELYKKLLAAQDGRDFKVMREHAHSILMMVDEYNDTTAYLDIAEKALIEKGEGDTKNGVGVDYEGLSIKNQRIVRGAYEKILASKQRKDFAAMLVNSRVILSLLAEYKNTKGLEELAKRELAVIEENKKKSK